MWSQVQLYVVHSKAQEVLAACERKPLGDMIHRLLEFQGVTHTLIRFVAEVPICIVPLN